MTSTSGRETPRFPGHRYPQVIPVPDEIRPGRPAPWAKLSASQRETLTLQVVQSALGAHGQLFSQRPIPTNVADLGISDEPLPAAITRLSAVLVGLFEREGEVHLILTRRGQHLRHHRGEVALPGGRSEEGESPVTTALREAAEEVGLDITIATPVGWLTPILTFASGSAIWPVVAVLDSEPELRADPAEVERVFTVSLSWLMDEGNFVEEQWRRAGSRPHADPEGFFPICFFRVPGEVVWGATARILNELLTVVTKQLGSPTGLVGD